MPEIEPGMNYCEAILLFIALLAVLGKLTYKDHKLLDRGLVELATKYREVLTKPFCIRNCVRAYPSGEKVYVNGTPIHMIVFKITK